MKLKIDEQADALYLTLSDDAASGSEEVAPGIIMDYYNAAGQVVGIEMPHLSKRAPHADLRRWHVESVPAAERTAATDSK
jgi:uncharacterized protein YuzE